MKASQLRARYWRIVFFFGGVTAGFIFWEIFLPRIGLKAARAIFHRPSFTRCGLAPGEYNAANAAPPELPRL